MPWAAAAAVTSGSFAAPSSIEYSVWTCRCAKESEDGVLLTGGLCSSVVVPARPAEAPAGDRWGRPAVRETSPEVASGVAPILALLGVYAEGLTGRVPHRRTVEPPRPPHPSHTQGGTRDGAGPPSESPDHRHVRDPGLLVLVADGGVAGPLVERARGDLGVQLDLGHAAQLRLPVQ